jgi:hypothetical protein
VRDVALPAVIALAPAVLAGAYVGNQFNGHTVSAILAMSATGYAIALAAVVLVTARRNLGLVRRALLAAAITAGAALTGLFFLYLTFSGVHDMS